MRISATTKAAMGDRNRLAVLPTVEPMPVNSIQFPSTIPKTSSLPEKALSNSRIKTSCVKNADRPRQQTAGKNAERR